MTPDEIEKDRAAGTPETHEPDYKAAMLYHSDRADAYMSERDALTAENAALEARAKELEAALIEKEAELIYLRSYGKDGAIWSANDSKDVWRDKARAALEKSHE